MDKRLIVIVGIVVIVAIAIFAFQGKQLTATPQVVVESTPAAKEITQTVTRYKDGTYTVVGDYTSPGGAEHIGVTVTLKGDVIENADVKSMAERPNAIKFQGIFIQNYKSLVVGKAIDEVKLDVVSGSSLTPKGFNDALEKVKAEAKA